MPTLQTQLALIEERLLDARRSFGDTNTVLTHYNYLKLALLLQDDSVAAEFRKIILSTLREISRLTFGAEGVAGIRRRAISQPQRYCYSFPRGAYEVEYRLASARFRSAIRDRLVFIPDHQYLFNKFIYVLGMSFQWRYCLIPQSVRAALVGNGDLTRMPFHPILAEDLGLTVSLAGEVAFRWPIGSAMPDIVFVNNVSGHYRPQDWPTEQLNLIIRRTLSLSDEVSIVSLANDGVAISGPLERRLELSTPQS
ncbi:MAG: hypothetical protein J0H49_09705 [Acidobacteria bacterium]|nr:hypothetical protein [Acidobacteriota bacterium]